MATLPETWYNHLLTILLPLPLFRCQLGLLGSGLAIRDRLEERPSPERRPRPRQELQTQDPGPQRGPVAPTAPRRLRQPTDQEAVTSCLRSRREGGSFLFPEKLLRKTAVLVVGNQFKFD